MKIIISCLLILSTLSVYGQKKKKNKSQEKSPIEATENSDSIFMSLASEIGDLQVITTKLYELASKAENQVPYLEQIAYIYLSNRNYQLCLNTSKRILKLEVNNINGLNFSASSLQAMGQKEQAIIAYQKLIAVKQDPTAHYQLASLYFETKNYSGCQEYLSKVMADSTSMKKEIAITFQDTDQQYKQQNVNLIAASYNIFAFMLIESGDKLTAIKYLEEALKISPNFALAKGNLATILKEEELVEKK